jgi:Kdo2-lipid IVA lauroyltransferase/acyltransferase
MQKNKRPFKKLKRDISFILISGIIGFLRFLPRNAALSFGSMIGRLIPLIDRKIFKDSIRHLTIAFGAEKSAGEIRGIARKSFIGLCMNFVDTVRLHKMSPEEVISVCVPHNMNILREAVAQGKGVIGLTSHAGCWELLGAYMAINGISVSVIANKLYDSRFEKMMTETREGKGLKVISRGQDTREIIRSIKAGDLLGVLIDQDMKVKGDFVDFFGIPAFTATAPAGLSLRYDAPILPIFTYMDSERQHHICVGKEVKIEKTGDIDKDILELTARCLKANEQFVREHPDQWVWFHDRWKTKPKKTAEDKTIKEPVKM